MENKDNQSAPHAGSSSSVLLVNPEVQRNYGPILSFLEKQKMLAGYDKVLVMSDREFKIMKDHYADKSSSEDGKLPVLFDKIFPGQSVHRFFPKTEEHSKLNGFFTGTLMPLVDDYRGGVKIENPAVASVTAKGNQSSARIGFILLPEKFMMTPESLITVQNDSLMKKLPADPALLSRRRQDMAAFVVAHEVAHLEDAYRKGNSFVLSGEDSSQYTLREMWEREHYADQRALGLIPAMQKSGLIVNPEIGQEIQSARMIETMQKKLLNAHKKRADGEENPEGILPHSIGFNLPVPSGQEFDGLVQAMTPIGKIRDERNQKICADARRGVGDPEHVKSYKDMYRIGVEHGSQTTQESAARACEYILWGHVVNDPTLGTLTRDLDTKKDQLPSDARSLFEQFRQARDTIFVPQAPALQDSSGITPKPVTHKMPEFIPTRR